MSSSHKFSTNQTIDLKIIVTVLNMADVATESIKDEAVATTPAVLSKNQAKKQKKHEMRLLAKQLKKEQSKKRKIGDIEAIDAVKIEENSEQLENRLKVPQYIANEKSKNERKLREAEENERKCASNFSVVIDCDWEDKHSEGTMKSLTQQLMFCYGINRKHECPAAMYLTGVGPKVTANLSKSNFKNWQGVQILSESYLDLPAFTLDAIEPDDMSGKKQLVYLTSDAEETLESLDPKCAYIIGGIVDRNRHKFATFNKAKAQGVRVALVCCGCEAALSHQHTIDITDNDPSLEPRARAPLEARALTMRF